MGLAYETIREDLLGGLYEPGDRLGIGELRDRYGIGASPIREALSRLAESGLIVALPNRGYRVATVSREEYRDLVDMRLTLEPGALARSIGNADLDWEARVAAAYQRLASTHRQLVDGAAAAYRDWAREDRGFHLALISNCGSDWLLRFCRSIYDQTARYHRDRILTGVPPVRKTEREHNALMEAAIARDADTACDLLRGHIESVARRIESATWNS